MGPETHRQQLPHGLQRVVSILIVHVDREVLATELPYELPAHPTGRSRWSDIGCDGEGSEAQVTLRDGPRHGGTFAADAWAEGGVFDVGARDVLAGGGEDRCPDPEVRVGAWRRS